jgi:hypothetical protein
VTSESLFVGLMFVKLQNFPITQNVMYGKGHSFLTNKSLGNMSFTCKWNTVEYYVDMLKFYLRSYAVGDH